MKKSDELRQEKAEKVDKMRSILKEAEEGKRSLSKSEREEAARLKAESEDLTAKIQIADAEEREQADIASEIILNGDTIRGKDFQRAYNRLREKNSKSLLGRFMAAALGSDDKEMRTVFTSTSGANVIPTPVMDSFVFDSLANNPLAELGAVFRQDQNKVIRPRLSAYPDTGWLENQGDQISEDASLTVAGVQSDFKDLTMRIVVQDQVMLDSSPDFARLLETAAAMAASEAVLRAVFHGGTGAPTGLDALSGKNTVAGGSAVLGDYAEIITGVYELLADNVQMERIGMVAHPIIWKQLAGLADSTGQPLMKPMGIDEMQMRWTSAIATNQGVGTDETSIYLADWSKLIVSLGGPYRFLTDARKSYLQSEFIFWLRVDTNFLQPDHFCVISAVATA